MVGTRSFNEVSLVSALNKIEAVLERTIYHPQMIELSKHASRVHGGIKMIEGIPLIIAAKEGLFEGHVKVLLRAKGVAPMTFPRCVAGHSLMADPRYYSVPSTMIMS